jgi:hypothetical protein
MDIVNFTSSQPTGKALRIGAGVQLLKIFEATHAQGFLNAGETNSSVDLARGYTQGLRHVGF